MNWRGKIFLKSSTKTASPPGAFLNYYAFLGFEGVMAEFQVSLTPLRVSKRTQTSVRSARQSRGIET